MLTSNYSPVAFPWHYWTYVLLSSSRFRAAMKIRLGPPSELEERKLIKIKSRILTPVGPVTVTLQHAMKIRL